jgi:hypothetical protein
MALLVRPASLGDPSRWPSQSACLDVTKQAFAKLVAEGLMNPIDVKSAARLLSGAAIKAALWVAATDKPPSVVPKAIDAFQLMAKGFLPDESHTCSHQVQYKVPYAVVLFAGRLPISPK